VKRGLKEVKRELEEVKRRLKEVERGLKEVEKIEAGTDVGIKAGEKRVRRERRIIAI
jgi:chaperonin cofactor prefoldin